MDWLFEEIEALKMERKVDNKTDAKVSKEKTRKDKKAEKVKKERKSKVSVSSFRQQVMF